MKPSVRDVTAVVPVRNAADLLPACLESLRASGVADIVVVDGLSHDASREIARSYGATVISDDGLGLPVARQRGVEYARTRCVALVDADVVFPPDAMVALVQEYLDGEYAALQAGLHSVSGPGYWGQALTFHHRTGRSRSWFGVVATLVDRDFMLAVGFDEKFRSGEDIELRWRLRDAGRRIGVSRKVLVHHRFAGDDFAFARDQFLMDGEGLGRMSRKLGWRGLPLLALPVAAGARGVLLSVAHRQPRWIAYFAAFVGYNYRGIWRGLVYQ
jgi:glycosyltransferase involved in cell wall biosynthesis